jgi:hypothetical protein
MQVLVAVGQTTMLLAYIGVVARILYLILLDR